MQNRSIAIQAWIRQHESVLIVAIGCMAFCATGIFVILKYAALGYNALDLAIFRQVIAESARGHLFHFTIHPDLYLGDHIDFFLLLLVPFYALLPRAETLLVVQAAAVLSALWPLTVLTRRYLSSPWSLLVAFFYAGLFLVHNSMVFEFHTLVFVIPLLLGAIVFYEKRQLSPFFAILFLVLMIREDLGLVLVGFGILARLQRRSWRWWVLPAVVGLLWFLGSMIAAGMMNHEQYKFLAYYRWLGATPVDAFWNVMRHPWIILTALFRLQNIFFALVLLLVFCGMPLVRPAMMLPATPYLLALLFTSAGGDEITLRTHYIAPLLPFLLWSLVAGIRKTIDNPRRFMRTLHVTPPIALGTFLVLVTVYGYATMSPLRPRSWHITLSVLSDPTTLAARAVFSAIHPQTSVAAGYALQPALADRPALYSMHYAFTGTRQFSDRSYALPSTVEMLALDTQDALLYEAQYAGEEQKLRSGPSRLRAVIANGGFSPSVVLDRFVLFTKDSGNARAPLYTIGDAPASQRELGSFGPIRATWNAQPLMPVTEKVDGRDVKILPMAITWQTPEKLDTLYNLRITYRDAAGKIVATRYFPIGYGLYPTTDWQPNEPVTVRYRWLVPKLAPGPYSVTVALFSSKGIATLNSALSVVLEYSKVTPLGSPISLGTVALP